MIDRKAKRILIYSNAPWAGTGYGVEIAMASDALKKAGHEVAILANWGLKATILNANGIRIYPSGRDIRSNDVVESTARHFDADVIFTLYDVFALKFAQIATPDDMHTPWVAWVPIDTNEVTEPVRESLTHAQGVIAMSEHGHNALMDRGIANEFIPLGIHLEHYKQMDKAEARKRVGFDPDTFLVGVVGANKFSPGRKQLSEAIMAFKRFNEDVPNSTLYMHTNSSTSSQGRDLEKMFKYFEMEGILVFADQFALNIGYTPKQMVDVFNSFDLLLGASRGEGFGVPFIEAMACGVPCIGTYNTAMIELLDGVGWLLEGEPLWTDEGGIRNYVSTSQVHKALNVAYDEYSNAHADWQGRIIKGKKKAQEYDFYKVVAPKLDDYFRRGEYLS